MKQRTHIGKILEQFNNGELLQLFFQILLILLGEKEL